MTRFLVLSQVERSSAGDAFHLAGDTSPRANPLARGFGAGVWSGVAIPRMKKQKLTIPGYQVQHAYLVQCLRLVHEFGALRVLTIAYAMFPGRAQTAASAAAKRVVSNALKRGYLEDNSEPNSHRYYALTLHGARVLHSFDDSYRVRSTIKALEFYRHDHREWCNVVALAARHRGLNSLSEAQITGAAYSEILNIFSYVPDAVTYYSDDGENRAAWHEIELSRRSTLGTKKLQNLVQTLIEKRYLTHRDQVHNITLVMHCSTAKIERENHSVIKEALKAYNVLLGEDAKAAAWATATAMKAAEAAAAEVVAATEAAKAAEASGDEEAIFAAEAATAYAKEASDAAAAAVADTVEVAKKYGPAKTATYAAQIGAGDTQRWFLVYINRLPENVEEAWGSELPWPGAPGTVSSKIDVFLQPVVI